MTKIKTQGTDLYVANSATTALKLACITSFAGLSGARNKIDTTCFASVEMESEGGMADPGVITVGGIYDSADTVFADLITLKDSGDKVEWYIGGNDGTDGPTVAASVLTPPTDRTGITWEGYVSDIAWAMDANSVWKYTLSIQRSGPWTLVPAV